MRLMCPEKHAASLKTQYWKCTASFNTKDEMSMSGCLAFDTVKDIAVKLIPCVATCSIEALIITHHPDSKVRGARMGPTWGLQDPGGPHVGPMILVIWAYLHPTRESEQETCNLMRLGRVVWHL